MCALVTTHLVYEVAPGNDVISKVTHSHSVPTLGHHCQLRVWP